jgi:glutathione S-transferase
MPKLHGVNLSPFVRKVRIALAEKGIEYEHEQVLPFGQTPEYFALSPLGKVPCYQDGDLTIPDSSVIIDYLERVAPNPPLYPTDPGQRARALWYEEYADTKLVNALSTVFFQRFVGPKFMQQETDQAAVDAALNDEIPPILDYLEGELDSDGFLVGDHFSIADIAATSPFVNFAIAGESVDGSRWPKLAAYVERMHGRPHYKPIVEDDLAVRNS